jgi:ribosomal-protein-alanine N-acetyltransferase
VAAADRVAEVAAENEAAQHLYGSYGFETIGLRRGYYQPSNTDALVMQLELRDA